MIALAPLRCVLRLLPFAIALTSAPAYAQTVTFKKAILEVGDVRTEKVRSINDLDVVIIVNGQKAQSGKQRSEERSEKTIEVLEVSGGKPTRVRVRYGELQTIQKTPQQERQEQSSELAGKGFILTKVGDVITVTDDKGGKVEALRAEQVKSREVAAFEAEPSKLGSILPKRAIKVGETIPIDAEKASAVFREDGSDELVVEAMTLTLKETRTEAGARVAVFVMAVKGAVKSEGAAGPKIALDLSGTLVLGIDTLWPHALAMSGPLDFVQVQGGMSLDARGTTSSTIEARYRKAGEEGS